jgi:S-adenosylmethionine decarboxylase
MRQDALLRSGKGLENPSPTRKKGPVAVVAPVPAEVRDDHFAVRNGVPCAGVHLIVDLHGAEGLNDIDLIDATLRRCVAAARATLLHIHLHHFHPNGVSGGEPHLDSYLAGYRLCGARRVHVRQGRA